jgi:hypothetical protein
MRDDYRRPRNTTSAMQDDAERLLFLADSWGRGPGDFIMAQESAGQRELVNSDVIPTDTRGATDQELEALGFDLGPVVDDNPMFRRVTLPRGWTREGSEHAMWSHLLDDLGRRRCSIFYKAAFYDRSAHMSVTTVKGYVADRAYDSKHIVLDDEWATKRAVLAAIDELRAYDIKQTEFWANHGNEEYTREHAEKVTKWDVIRRTVEAVS